MDGARGTDGKLYMIPSGVFIFALMLNQTMADAAEAAGVAPLPNPYTWNQLAEYAARRQADAARRRQRDPQHGPRDRTRS